MFKEACTNSPEVEKEVIGQLHQEKPQEIQIEEESRINKTNEEEMFQKLY